MFKKLLSTNDNAAIAVARVLLGAVLFPHGAQKLLGWFGGYGFTGTMGFLTGAAHLPYIIALLVIIIEFFGSLMLIIGFATRYVALSVIILFIGIILTDSLQNGFFMNWGGNQHGEGFEYHILVLAIALALLINGAGKWSADKAITKAS
jgi:putative oxidoreductase